MNDGWIKLHRRILDNDIWRFDYTAWRVFETLLLLCNRKDGVWKGGRFQLAGWCGDMNPSTCYAALVRLKNAKMITLSSNNKYTTFRICKWEDYQGNGNTKGQQPDNNQITTRQHSNKNKEVRSKNITTISEVDKKLLTILNETLNREFRILPKGSEKILSLFTLNEIETAMKNLAADEWHSGRLQTLKIDYLMRDTTIDKFRVEGSAQVGEPSRIERLNLLTGKMELVG